jgi:hypothetical protein
MQSFNFKFGAILFAAAAFASILVASPIPQHESTGVTTGNVRVLAGHTSGKIEPEPPLPQKPDVSLAPVKRGHPTGGDITKKRHDPQVTFGQCIFYLY